MAKVKSRKVAAKKKGPAGRPAGKVAIRRTSDTEASAPSPRKVSLKLQTPERLVPTQKEAPAMPVRVRKDKPIRPEGFHPRTHSA